MNNQSFKNFFCAAMGLAVLIACFGCASAPEPVQPPAGATAPQPQEAKETYYTHAVKWPGESLSIIAAWYTGDVQNWKDLAEANPDINPNRIHEGMKIRIPESIMTTKTPMTKEHVESYYPKPKKPVAKPSSPYHPKEEEPVLYGPKQYPSK
jgi:hypothetical protein